MSQGLDKQLYSAIELLNDKQKKAVLGIVQAFTDDGSYGDHWEDENFVREMDSRYAYYKSGGKMVTPEELNKQADELLEKIRAKKK